MSFAPEWPSVISGRSSTDHPGRSAIFSASRFASQFAIRPSEFEGKDTAVFFQNTAGNDYHRPATVQRRKLRGGNCGRVMDCAKSLADKENGCEECSGGSGHAAIITAAATGDGFRIGLLVRDAVSAGLSAHMHGLTPFPRTPGPYSRRLLRTLADWPALSCLRERRCNFLC